MKRLTGEIAFVASRRVVENTAGLQIVNNDSDDDDDDDEWIGYSFKFQIWK